MGRVVTPAGIASEATHGDRGSAAVTLNGVVSGLFYGVCLGVAAGGALDSPAFVVAPLPITRPQVGVLGHRHPTLKLWVKVAQPGMLSNIWYVPGGT
jgi:hypothetical protein